MAFTKKKHSGMDLLKQAAQAMSAPQSARKHRAGKPMGNGSPLSQGSLNMQPASYLRGKNVNPIANVGGKAVGAGYQFAKKGKGKPTKKAAKAGSAPKFGSPEWRKLHMGKKNSALDGRVKVGKKLAHKGHTHKSKKSMAAC